MFMLLNVFFFSSRRRHTRWPRDWSSDVCSSDLVEPVGKPACPLIGELRCCGGRDGRIKSGVQAERQEERGRRKDERRHPGAPCAAQHHGDDGSEDRKSTRLNSSHVAISYAVFCLKKKKRKRSY